MANNKITIGDGKNKDKKEIRPNLPVDKPQVIIPNIEVTPPEETVEMPLDENVWGNDNTVLKKLDADQLAERRLFVRVIFMRQIKCYETYNNLEEEAKLLIKPIEFSITDLSVGGIGIIADYELKKGTILGFKLPLDQAEYDIKCEVMYCFQNDNKFRIGLRIVQKEKDFIKHLKIVIARISLRNQYTEK